MNKTTLTAATVLVAGAAVVSYIRIHANIIAKQFPDVDPKIAKKAHSIMMKRAFAGQYGDITDASDETMTRIFRDVVKELLAK